MTSFQSRTDMHGNIVTCTECARYCQGSSADNGYDKTIENALQARSSDQDRILTRSRRSRYDPGRGQFHRRVLGDYP